MDFDEERTSVLGQEGALDISAPTSMLRVMADKERDQ